MIFYRSPSFQSITVIRLPIGGLANVNGGTSSQKLSYFPMLKKSRVFQKAVVFPQWCNFGRVAKSKGLPFPITTKPGARQSPMDNSVRKEIIDHLFFQVISARHGAKSTLTTTNLPFALTAERCSTPPLWPQRLLTAHFTNSIHTECVTPGSNKKGLRISRNPLKLLVPGTRIELVRGIASRDFKSLASTYSATQAYY
jgi:hypothetical protein